MSLKIHKGIFNVSSSGKKLEQPRLLNNNQTNESQY